jgi:hypothetical protein
MPTSVKQDFAVDFIAKGKSHQSANGHHQAPPTLFVTCCLNFSSDEINVKGTVQIIK